MKDHMKDHAKKFATRLLYALGDNKSRAILIGGIASLLVTSGVISPAASDKLQEMAATVVGILFVLGLVKDPNPKNEGPEPEQVEVGPME